MKKLQKAWPALSMFIFLALAIMGLEGWPLWVPLGFAGIQAGWNPAALPIPNVLRLWDWAWRDFPPRLPRLPAKAGVPKR